LTSFWLLSGIQLSFLISTLPHDQAAMEDELARFVASTAAERQLQQQQHESNYNRSIINENDHCISSSTTVASNTVILNDVEKNPIINQMSVDDHLMYEDYETTSLLSQQQQNNDNSHNIETSSSTATAENDNNSNTTKHIHLSNLSHYNTFQHQEQEQHYHHHFDTTDSEPMIVTIEDRIASFDDVAAIETLTYVQESLLELSGPILYYTCGPGSCGTGTTTHGVGTTITEESTSSSVNMYDSRSNSSCDDDDDNDEDYSTDDNNNNYILIQTNYNIKTDDDDDVSANV
jgi:hypothetical protein